MNKKIGIGAALLLLAALLVWKLQSNKAQLESDASLSRVTRRFVPVEVISPAMEALGATLETNGIFLPAKEMFVISETQGRVVEVYKGKGDWVQEGDVIAKVDDELLNIELQATQANLAKLRKDKDRIGVLIEGEAINKNKIEDIELGIMAAEAREKTLKKQIANTAIKAPMSGAIGMRFIERGSVIGPGIQVAQITNLEKLFLMVKVSEHDVLHIRKGQTAVVRPDVYPNTELPGRITNIGLRADNAFNYDVEIEVQNPVTAPLRGGMHANAVFQFGNNRRGLSLPRRAVVGSLQDARVYIVQDSMAYQRKISLGAVMGDKVEVLSGLGVSDLVVITGQLNLSEGARVAVLKR